MHLLRGERQFFAPQKTLNAVEKTSDRSTDRPTGRPAGRPVGAANYLDLPALNRYLITAHACQLYGPPKVGLIILVFPSECLLFETYPANNGKSQISGASEICCNYQIGITKS